MALYYHFERWLALSLSLGYYVWSHRFGRRPRVWSKWNHLFPVEGNMRDIILGSVQFTRRSAGQCERVKFSPSTKGVAMLTAKKRGGKRIVFRERNISVSVDIGILLGHFSNQLAVVILGSFFCFLRLRALRVQHLFLRCEVLYTFYCWCSLLLIRTLAIPSGLNQDRCKLLWMSLLRK